ncbi:BON domain-containing protein [Caballeronia sp. LjRoot29]|uniref:BON domain-containing protein n=1 Tax=Caballeronia sp. LjRoot29 TaxID=3342315 RepID=UPI003ECC343E
MRIPDSDKRADEEIASAARSVLRWIAGLTEGAVRIAVEKGRVTLSGEVASGYQRNVAASNVARLRGVALVVNGRVRYSTSPQCLFRVEL